MRGHNLVREYKVKGTSQVTAEVGDIVLKETGTTRLVLRSLLVVNQKNESDTVRVALVHQRRRSEKESWEDASPFSLASLKAHEAVKLDLSAGATRRLLEALQELYVLPADGWADNREKKYTLVDSNSALIVTGQEKDIVTALLDQQGAQLLKFIAEQQPDLLKAAADLERQEERRAVVSEFDEHVLHEDWDELHWQRFFDANKWIFGHNLAYQILKTVASQGHVGGTMVTGKGAQRTDEVLATEAHARFTVLVDIKRPDTELIVSEPYRNRVYAVSNEVAGGVAQLQSYCRRWVVEGSSQEDNEEMLRDKGIYTYEPKGILVVGDTWQLNTQHKRASFEMFRKNLHNPEILTYDELLARAKYSVTIDPEETW